MEAKSGSKKKGITLIETLIAIGILGIIISLIYPTITIFNKSRLALNEENIYFIHYGKLLEQIEDIINEAVESEENFEGKNNLKNGKGVYLSTLANAQILDNNFLSNTQIEGNLLFIANGKYKKNTYFQQYIAFLFEDKSLYLIYYEKVDNKLKQSKKEILANNVNGNFKIDKYKIRILLEYEKDYGKNKIVKNNMGLAKIGRK